MLKYEKLYWEIFEAEMVLSVAEQLDPTVIRHEAYRDVKEKIFLARVDAEVERKKTLN